MHMEGISIDRLDSQMFISEIRMRQSLTYKNTIFGRMNIHLPDIVVFTMVAGFWSMADDDLQWSSFDIIVIIFSIFKIVISWYMMHDTNWI